MNRLVRLQAALFLVALLLSACGGGSSGSADDTDATPPTVTAVSPANNAVGVGLNTTLSATFSEAMQIPAPGSTPFTLVPTAGGAAIAGTISFSGTTAIFTPAASLAPNTQFRATITTVVRDLAGLPLAAPFIWTFTTGPVPDTTRPTVSSINPANNALNVAPNAALSATFSEAMNNASLSTASFTLAPAATPGALVAGAVTVSGNTATFTPAASLAASTLFTATITTGATDAAGNALAANFTWNFTTGMIADLTPPVVSFNAPANGAINVAVNSSVASATFSEPMNNATLTTASFTLAQAPAGPAVVGTVSVSGNTASFTPVGDLLAFTVYTATITTAARDAAGNALAAPFSWSFTTGPGSDTTPPTVSAINPANNALNVAPNAALSAGFSEAMNNVTLTTASFTLAPTASPGTPVAGTVNVSGNTATFTPLAPLAFSTQFTATITTAATDAAGNALAAPFTWNFTTGAAPDVTPPTVSAINPTNNALNVASTTSVSATFSEPMNNATLTNVSFTLAAGGPVAGTVNVSGNTATFTPSAPLAFSTPHTATITTAATDAAGNALAAPFSWNFTTGAVPDSIAPTVSFTAPANGATNVSLNSSVSSATFSEPMNNATLTNVTFSLVRTSDDDPVAGTVGVSGNTAAFTPSVGLLPLTQYTATISTAVTDTAGNALAAPFNWTFTTGAAADTTPPTVTTVVPANAAAGVATNIVVQLTFSEAMTNASLNTSSITLAPTATPGSPVAGTVTISSNTASFTPLAPLAATTQFTLTVSTAVTDAAGNALAMQFNSSFTTGAVADTTPPLLLSTSVDAPGNVNVAVNASVSVTFNEPMNNVTLNTANITLAPTATPLATIASAVSVTGNTATFTPLAPLAQGTNFTLTITNGVTDAAGNVPPGNVTRTFTTAADMTPPAVLSTSIVNGATNVSVNSALSVTFSETMNNATLNAATFVLSPAAAGTFGFSGNTVTFTPSAPLAASTPYTLTITGATDVAGNALPVFMLSFTTAAGAVAACPTSPTNGTAVGAITPNLSVSRASGVGPLAVFFDATATTHTNGALRPFHDIEYRWAFGDPAGGATWNNGSGALNPARNSRDAATGPLAAHVFETPGTYTVTMSAFDGATTAPFSCQITVTDPNVDFAASTVCVAATGAVFTGCPIACPSPNCITNADFVNVINSVAANGSARKRILFKRGDTFSVTGNANISADGPGLVGAFGPGAIKPVFSGGSGTQLSLGSSVNHDFADWRFVDVDFDGVNRAPGAVTPAGGASKILFLRNNFRRLNVVFNLPSSTLDFINTSSTLAPMWAEWALVDNTISDNQSYAFLGFLNRATFLGNLVTGQLSQHGIRLAYASKAVISNNEATGTSTGTALTVRGTDVLVSGRPGTPNIFTLPEQSFTEQVVISDNKLLAGQSLLPFTVKTVNSVENARFRNILVERNWMVAGTLSNIFFETEAAEATIRNNLFDLSLAPGPYRAIGLIKSTGTPVAATNIGIFNNSAFSSAASSAPFIVVDVVAVSPGGLNIANVPTNLTIQNNLGFAPLNTNATTAPFRGNTTGAGFSAANNSASGTGVGSIRGGNPNFAVTPPLLPFDWRLSAGYARDGGLNFVPAAPKVFRDFFDNVRPANGTIDIGATEQ